MRFDQIFEYPIKEFVKHLEQENNERIVFSGKYGSGKTTFIKDFFEDKNQQQILEGKKYRPFHLFPVSYSIASNEDIIRYIKFDLIIQFLIQGITLEEIKLGIIDTLPQYVKKDLLKIAKTIISMVPKIGKDVVEHAEELNELVKLFFEYHQEANKTDGDKMLQYLNKIRSGQGSIYENDVITQIISRTMKKAKGEPILIIDDLDRLDPEHTFRILNVFAAHFDTELYSGEKNKFGFEKIILVCDFKNIRRIFHNKYGRDVDFVGYVDKFYSSDVYHFDNTRAVSGIVSQVLASLTFEDDEMPNAHYQMLYLGNDFVRDILQMLLKVDLLSLRSLIKLYGKRITYHKDKIILPREGDRYAATLPMTLQLKLLTYVLADVESYYSVMDRCSLAFNGEDPEPASYDIYAAHLFHILAGDDYFFRNITGYPYKFGEDEIYVEFKNDFGSGVVQSVNLSKVKYNDAGKPEKGDYYRITPAFFWKVMKAVVEKLERLGYIA